MKLLKHWGNWQDICIRESSNGTHYLLQMRVREDGKKQFRNRRLDADGFPYLLFQGNDDLSKIINKS